MVILAIDSPIVSLGSFSEDNTLVAATGAADFINSDEHLKDPH